MKHSSVKGNVILCDKGKKMLGSSSSDITKVTEFLMDHIESPLYRFTFTHSRLGRLRQDQ